MLKSENSDQLLREIGLVVSTRGVVFFRNQNLVLAQQKEFVRRISRLTGGPEVSGFHRYPSGQSYSEFAIDQEAAKDDEVTVISNIIMRKMYDPLKQCEKSLPKLANGTQSKILYT